MGAVLRVTAYTSINLDVFQQQAHTWSADLRLQESKTDLQVDSKHTTSESFVYPLCDQRPTRRGLRPPTSSL